MSHFLNGVSARRIKTYPMQRPYIPVETGHYNLCLGDHFWGSDDIKSRITEAHNNGLAITYVHIGDSY